MKVKIFAIAVLLVSAVSSVPTGEPVVNKLTYKMSVCYSSLFSPHIELPF